MSGLFISSCLSRNSCLQKCIPKIGFVILLNTVFSCSLIQPKTVIYKNPELGLKTVHTLDVYEEANTIHGLFSGVDQHSQQVVLRYINSENAGATWSDAITIKLSEVAIKQSKRGNDFQVAAYNNKVMAVWRAQGGEPWVGVIAGALSIDKGKTWRKINSPVSEKYAKIDQGYFDLTADSQGQFHLSWLDDREESGNTQVLRYASYSEKNANWNNHKILEESACTCCWSDIEADENGNIHVLFRDDKPRDMLTISSLDAGKSWQTPEVVWPFNWEFVGCPHQGGGLITTYVDNAVTLHSIIWNGVEETRGLYYANSDKKSVPLEYLDNEWSDSGDIAALDNENIAVVFTTRVDDKKVVMSKFSDDKGETWSETQLLTREGAEPSHPRIVSTPEGYRFFWTEWQENGDATLIMSELN